MIINAGEKCTFNLNCRESVKIRCIEKKRKQLFHSIISNDVKSIAFKSISVQLNCSFFLILSAAQILPSDSGGLFVSIKEAAKIKRSH